MSAYDANRNQSDGLKPVALEPQTIGKHSMLRVSIASVAICCFIRLWFVCPNQLSCFFLVDSLLLLFFKCLIILRYIFFGFVSLVLHDRY